VRYLLDSTVLIDHANRDEPAAELLERLFSGPHELYTCDIVTCETLSQGDADHLRHLRVLLNALEYVATTPDAARWAANSRHKRHRAGGSPNAISTARWATPPSARIARGRVAAISAARKRLQRRSSSG